jgi:hypothetical protein
MLTCQRLHLEENELNIGLLHRFMIFQESRGRDDEDRVSRIFASLNLYCRRLQSCVINSSIAMIRTGMRCCRLAACKLLQFYYAREGCNRQQMENWNPSACLDTVREPNQNILVYFFLSDLLAHTCALQSTDGKLKSIWTHSIYCGKLWFHSDLTVLIRKCS